MGIGERERSKGGNWGEREKWRKSGVGRNKRERERETPANAGLNSPPHPDCTCLRRSPTCMVKACGSGCCQC